MKRAGVRVLVLVKRFTREPVGEVGHVERGDREDVEQALVAPGE